MMKAGEKLRNSKARKHCEKGLGKRNGVEKYVMSALVCLTYRGLRKITEHGA
jgi:hypothetical protein